MSAQSPAPPTSRRSVARRRVGATLILVAVLVGFPLWIYWGDLQHAEYDFELGRETYRVRVTGWTGSECVRLEKETRFARTPRWTVAGKDCVWPRVGRSDGVLAGGQAHKLSAGTDTDGQAITSSTSDWVFYGIVPEAATEVVLTLDGGQQIRIATREVEKAGDNRIYAHQQAGLPPSLVVKVVEVALRDASGGEIRVF